MTDKYSESKKFYAETLELSVVRDVPDEEFTQFKLQNCYLVIYGRTFAEKLFDKKYLTQAGGAIYTFAQVDEVDKIYAELKAKGVQWIKEPTTQPWGQRTAYFTDPDGHIWEIQKWIKV